MDFNLHTVFPVEDRSYLALIKNKIKDIGQELLLGDTEIGKLNIIATELVTNLIKFGEHGREILIKPVVFSEVSGVEIVSIDKGSGAKDPVRMMEDGYSTAGTKGEGLGAIKRLSDEFDIYSQSTGTIVLARVFKKTKSLYPKTKEGFEVGGVMVAKIPETVCGDQWHYVTDDNGLSLAVIDGLGHGKEANEAAVEAINIYKENIKSETPDFIVDKIHSGLKKTRGAVGLIIHADNQKKNMIHCGVGNIGCKVISNYSMENAKSLILFNGILGLNVKRMNSTINIWDNTKTMVVHSDGLTSRWDLHKYPGILNRHPTIIAAVLYRDFNRRTDDITVVVARTKRAINYV
ncbi:ATP-binding protein [Sporocytophaga myxococcoides]|uniref:ATP-binding protein n=1 Tax=Sporocytophaga myxococcoides TaxID=153721 RepID=UPI0004286D66|nr:ATP-binding protein [Sporocytophaga myxococcoides]